MSIDPWDHWARRSRLTSWGPHSIGIPTIKSRATNIPKDKGNDIRDYMNPWHRGSTDKIFVEYVGSNMDIQVPLLDIGREVSQVMST